MGNSHILMVLVSIPFKRESLSKDYADERFNMQRHPWQRMPNNPGQYEVIIVSIPFKRESLSKAMQRIWHGCMIWKISFNSLQTGKPIQRPSAGGGKSKAEIRVSIPFKRESLSKVNGDNPRILAGAHDVSIPFKRESLSKEINPKMVSVWEFSFNSLQTGKPIQRDTAENEDVLVFGFNSLQTGKPIQSLIPTTRMRCMSHLVSIPFKRESLSKVF